MKKTAPKKRPMSESVSRYLFCTGIAALAFVFFTFALAMLGFVVKVPITPFHLIAALAGTALACVFLSWYYYGQKRSVDVKVALSMMAVIAVLLLSCWMIAHSFYDTSYDGVWYHQGAIYQLMNGYNPVYGQVPDSYSGAAYIGHYPKALEISSAVINAFTQHIEDGKLLNIFLMVTAFLLIFPAIVFSFPKINLNYALVISALCAFNPVSVYQSLSYYVDGVSASLLAILVFLLILSFRNMDEILFAAITAVIIVSINFKFFDLIYVGLIVMGFIAICHFNKKANRLHYLLIASLAAGVLFGANPYIYNVIDHGTPFYPVEGISTDMISGDTPQNMAGRNSVEQFLYSIFSESSVKKDAAMLKMPLTLGSQEGEAFRETDARVGGFGPFFSAVFILAAIVAIFLIYMDIKEKRLLGDLMILVCVLVLISVLVNPADWWARYVPQLWLIPLLLLVCSSQRFTGNMKLLNFAVIALLAVNVLYVASMYYPYQSQCTTLIENQLKPMKALSAQDAVKLYPGPFPASEERLKEYGVNYVLIDELMPGNDGYPMNGMYNKTRFYVNITG